MLQKSLTYLLAEVANRLIIFVQNNAYFVHQSDLLLIVSFELCRARVDIREKAKNALSSDRLSLCGCSCSRHREVKSGWLSCGILKVLSWVDC